MQSNRNNDFDYIGTRDASAALSMTFYNQTQKPCRGTNPGGVFAI
jgi:hypothetical protein